MIKWVELLLHNFSAVINHCGNISKKLCIGRGARQGDPISSYLFIICVEILAHKLRSDNKIQGFQLGNLVQTVEMYADDCTVFLQPFDENLRNAVKTLSEFFNLSGLKISVTKTKAVWFGKDFASVQELCPDLKLDWTREFTLLGMKFQNNLENMEVNFNTKLEVIKKLLNCWFYRTLTVYGKITVIKTLALSKLSHLALVLPNLNNKKIKEIESLFFKFLWGNKPDKVSRDHCKLSEKAGGLGFIDVKEFWSSLKFSWLRRLCNTSAFWPKILTNEINRVSSESYTTSDLLQLGPKMLENIGKKLKNKFWSQVLCSVTPFMQGALFCHPEKIFISPFWENPSITKNNKPIKKSAFPTISRKINIIADFFHTGCGTGELLTQDEFQQKHDCIIDTETFIELHYIIKWH